MDQRPTYEDLEKQITALQLEDKEIRSAKRTIEASEAFHRIALENVSDTVIIADDHGQIIYACPNTHVIFGLSREQVYERGAVQELFGGTVCVFAELKKAREISDIEWSILDPAGKEHCLLIAAKLISANGGAVLYVVRDITERKKMEVELTQREKEYRTLVESLPDFVVRYDLNLRRTYVNPAWEKASGLTAAEVIDGPHTDTPKAPNPAAEEYVQKIRQVMETGVAQTLEFTWVNAHGTKIFLDHIIVPEYDRNGRVSGVLAVGRDISQRKQTEKELQQQKRLFETMFNTITDGVVITNRQREIQLANKGMESTFGYKPEELLGKSARLLYAGPDQYNETGEIVFGEDARKPGDIFVTYYRDKTGREFPGETFGAKLFDEYNRWIGNLGISRDITGRKRAEEALRQSEEKYRSMMEAFTDPLYICSPEFVVEYMNPAMIRRTGRDATGERCYYALHGLDARCDWCVFDKILNGKRVEATIKSPLDERTYRVTQMPIENQDGTISKMSTLRDITDYLQVVSEKEKAQAQLAQAQKMESIGNLAGGIAHDFNNILSSIIGFTELALDEAQIGTTLEDSLQEVYSAGKRAKDLVKQILAFARQSDERTSPIQPSAIVKEVLKFIRSTIPTTIEIRKEITSDALIMANATQVHQVLMNICTNAAHTMEDSGGVLAASVKDAAIDETDPLHKIGLKKGDYVRIKVSDTGAGIAPEIIGSIFDPYFTTKGPGEGSGMGLAVAHGIVEGYGGKITVDSRPGAGTTFTIYLPMTTNRERLRAYASKQLPTGSERILFVDDDAYITKMGKQLIELLGYSVTTRTSSIEALELFRTKPDAFDLVITDMTMPNLTGDKLAAELMKIRRDIPIMLCTGFSKKISDDAALEIGIKAFAYKPMVKADLAKKIRKVLDAARADSCGM